MTSNRPDRDPRRRDRLPRLTSNGRHLGLFLAGVGVGIILFSLAMPTAVPGPNGWLSVLALVQRRETLTIVGAAAAMLGAYLILRRR